ncbi:MAG: MerR family transcriptional regulator [Beijerinckiaceae bacterium]
MVRSQILSRMTIAGLARAAGVGVETVRYYQRRGLLPTPPKPSGNDAAGAVRRYEGEHLRRLRFVRSAQTAGFTLAEIAELIALDATDDRERARALAQGRIAALDDRIAELRAARAALGRLAAACGATGAGPCPILAAFEPPAVAGAAGEGVSGSECRNNLKY